ncbi:MAG: hypothetical protein ABUT20_17445 [Bacteroidota bacterium]
MTLQQQTSSVFSLEGKMGTKYFFLLIFAYQVFFIFQGIDFSDEGFSSTFYQQIFNDPASVQYNFMYWFSGVIGGAWLYLFPKFGLLGLRIGAVLINTSTIIITYNLLKKHVQASALQIGLFFCVMFMSYHPLALFYDHLTALFFVCSVWFLMEGITKHQSRNFFISGLFLSLNTFTRLPNASGLALVLIIFYSGLIDKQKIKYVFFQASLFIAGFGITTLIVLVIMHFTNQLTVFMDCINLVKSMSKSAESSHGLMRVMKVLSRDYFHSLVSSVLLSGLVIILGTIWKRFPEKKMIYHFIGFVIISLLTVFLIVFLKIKGNIDGWLYLIRTMTGFSILSTVLIVMGKGEKALKLIALSGAIVAFATTFGSDGGIMGAGRYSLWISLPVALHFFFNASYYLQDHPLFTRVFKNSSWPRSFANSLISLNRSATIFKLGTVVIFLYFLFFEFTYTWNDSRNRAKMTHTINNNFLKGIGTTDAKATSINELLQESARYLKKDDYLLAYGTIPLIHVATGTRPFIRNSWPLLYDQDVLRNELQIAANEQTRLPVIIYQKLKVVPNMNFPTDTTGSFLWDINHPGNTAIRIFINEHHYGVVWENSAFRIYIPGQTVN